MLNSVALIDPGPVRIQSGFSTPPPSYPIPSTLILSVGSDSPITLHHIPIQTIPYVSIAHPIAYHLNPPLPPLPSPLDLLSLYSTA